MVLTRYLGLVVAAAVSVGGMCIAAQAQQKDVKFVLDWAYQGHQAPFTIPVDDGTFAELGLNVTVDRGSGSGDTVAKVASGAYDIGLADIYTMVRFLGENPNSDLIAVMMLHDKSALAVGAMKSSGIDSPEKLNGKRMAAPIADASRQMFPLFAASTGVDEDSIQWSNISVELREPMLLNGESDATVGHLTTMLMNLRNLNVPAEDVNIMPYADYGVELYGSAVFTSKEYAENNPEVITNFLRGVAHGLNVTLNDPDAAVASVKKRDPLLNDEVEKARIEISAKAFFITPNVLENGLSNVDLERLDKTVKQVSEVFGITDARSAEEIYTSQYLPDRQYLKIDY